MIKVLFFSVLLLGLAFAGGSFLFSQGMTGSAHSSASESQSVEVEMVTLIAASVDIPFGSEITRDLLEAVDLPRSEVPVGSFDIRLIGNFRVVRAIRRAGVRKAVR